MRFLSMPSTVLQLHRTRLQCWNIFLPIRTRNSAAIVGTIPIRLVQRSETSWDLVSIGAEQTLERLELMEKMS